MGPELGYPLATQVHVFRWGLDRHRTKKERETMAAVTLHDLGAISGELRWETTPAHLAAHSPQEGSHA